MKRSNMMLPKLTGKPAASTHFNTAKGEVVYLATKTWDYIYKMQVSLLDSNDFKEDINTVTVTIETPIATLWALVRFLGA